ncbi:MAG: hypothetical protein GWP16_03510 [Nitrospirae bacterium]|nr:hypothetical protein [Nitrospirota bacterium]
MSEMLTSFTSLPNLHPALVHFPIALLPVALLFDLLGLVMRTQRVWLDRAATALYALAGLGTAATFWAGNRAADSLVGLSPQKQVLVGEHHDAALLAFWVVGLFTIVRIGIGIGFGSRLAQSQVLRAVLLLVAMAGSALVFDAADHGGGLVFQHGIAVAPAEDRLETGAMEIVPEPPDSSAEEADSGVESRLRRLEDGSIVWEPKAEDSGALGLVLSAAPGSSLEAVQWQEPVGSGQNGLAVRVQGSSLLLLPDEYGDVQVEADLEIDQFEGTVGLAHHVRSAGDAGLFLISTPSGKGRLSALSGGKEEVMAQGEATLGSGPLRLAAFAAGGHFRGLQDGEVVIHGHRATLENGRCGILLDGEGVVRILSIKVIPIVE